MFMLEALKFAVLEDLTVEEVVCFLVGAGHGDAGSSYSEHREEDDDEDLHFDVVGFVTVVIVLMTQFQ
jgi:hypothetical protein